MTACIVRLLFKLLAMDPLLSTVTLNVKRGKLVVESPEGRVKQVNT